MKKRYLVPVAALAAATMAAPAAMAATPAATAAKLGDRSLAAVLLADGDTFDHNWNDYDILTEAVLAVLEAKPDSAVQVLTQGDVALTAFLPSDRAFQLLAYSLTKKWSGSEKKVFSTLVETAGVDTIENILLYHVIPGATITSKDALKANGAKLNTALTGASIKVQVLSRDLKLIALRDNDYNALNPIINPGAFDINKGNNQIGHGIVFVLRPIDL